MHLYVRAAVIYKEKMSDMDACQSALMEGWRLNRDAYNCLEFYFNNIEGQDKKWASIMHIYREEAEMEYLKIAQELEMYGVNYFQIKVRTHV